MQVQATISAPGELAHKFSKANIRRKDVYLIAVLWETADFICTNPKCQRVTDGYGNYVSNLKKEIANLKAELAESKKDAAMLSWLEQQNMNIDNPDAWCVTRCDFTGEDVPWRFWVGSDLRGAIREVMKGK